MKDLPHAGLSERESTVPGPYGQCRTQVARGDIGQISKLNWGNLCAYLWFLLMPFVGLNGSKLVAKFT